MSGQPQALDQNVAASATKTKTEREQQKAIHDYGQPQDQTKASMHVKVYSPFRDYYDGQAFSLSAVNATGPFDILPHHHNFISLLNPCELIIRAAEKDEQRIRISGGILHVKADEVVVFLDV